MSSTLPLRRERVDGGAILLLVLLCAIWGLQQVTVKLAVGGGLPPIAQAAMRSVLAGSCLLAWTGWRRGGRGIVALLRIDRGFWPGLLAAVLFAGEFLALYPGLRLTSASRGVLFLYTSPFFVALGAHLLIPGERLRPRQAVGLLVAFAGVGVAFADGLLSVHASGDPRGDALCLLGGILWAATTLLVKRSPVLSHTEPGRVLMFQLGGSVPLLALASWLAGETLRLAAVSPVAWLSLGYSGMVVAFASYLGWFWLVLAYPAGRLAPFTFLTPLFGILAGALALHETVGATLLLGAAGVAAGLYLLNSR